MYSSSVSGGSGNHRAFRFEEVAKPNQGHMRLVNPLSVIGQEERQLLDAKREIVRNASEVFKSPNLTTLQQLLSQIDITIGQLFPNAGYILLARKNGEYRPIAQRGINFDPAELNLSGNNSIVKTAGDVQPGERRTIYIPDLSQHQLYLASKFDQDFSRDLHQLEEGEIETSGLSIDLFSLTRAKISSVAAAPSMEYNHLDPIAAILLVGERAFLNPYVDLVPLRELADSVAKPLKNRIPKY